MFRYTFVDSLSWRAAAVRAFVNPNAANSSRLAGYLGGLTQPGELERQVRSHSTVIGNARNEKVGKSHSCMVSSRKPGRSRRRGF